MYKWLKCLIVTVGCRTSALSIINRLGNWVVVIYFFSQLAARASMVALSCAQSRLGAARADMLYDSYDKVVTSPRMYFCGGACTCSSKHRDASMAHATQNSERCGTVNEIELIWAGAHMEVTRPDVESHARLPGREPQAGRLPAAHLTGAVSNALYGAHDSKVLPATNSANRSRDQLPVEGRQMLLSSRCG
jgi:hypothetical protein